MGALKGNTGTEKVRGMNRGSGHGASGDGSDGFVPQECKRPVARRHPAHMVAVPRRSVLQARGRNGFGKLIPRIEDALRSIQGGLYRYREVAGEQFELARVEARPIQAQSWDAQQRREFLRRQRIR